MKIFMTMLLVALGLMPLSATWAQDAAPVPQTQNQTPADVLALPQLQSLAAQGNATAQFNLGVMFDFGQSVAADPAEAVRWYRLAAAQGHAAAQFNLGGMYFEGLGVAQDYVRAYQWFTLAGVAGYAGAAKNRNSIASLMTPEQISQAQTLARDCQRRNFAACD